MAELLLPNRPRCGASAEWLRGTLKARRLRASYFDADLFADPAWDIMLDLHLAAGEGRKVSVSSLCVAAAVPASTALRWIKLLEGRGIVERTSDPGDGRRIYVALSASAADRLTRLLASVSVLGVTPV